MSYSQQNRFLSLTSSLPDDVLLIRRMSGTEEIGRPFHFVLELSSEDPEIALADVLGQSMTVRMKVGESDERYFNGVVTSFDYTGNDGRLFNYRAVLRPWIWLLGRSADCRIFQNTTVPDIVKTVMRDAGFSDFEEDLEGEYREWEYCVQYRETKLNFVSRLMEQEGCYYYFRHEEGSHIAVITDSIIGHAQVPGLEEVPFFPPESSRSRDGIPHLSTWNVGQRIQPGETTLDAYDFTKPKANLESKGRIAREHKHSEYEFYDYPGEYYETSDGDNYARVRLEELQAGYEVAEGSGSCAGLHAGALFTLTDHPRGGQDVEWLITKAAYDITADPLTSGEGGGGEASFVTKISCINSTTPFRTPRTTPKPIVQGPQTAIVVGPSSDHINVDEYGRVKVQFHWDREGTSDENSSCWVRVSQVWAGKGYGSMHIPHIGHEVVVDFLEGDPDRPYVSGRLYNADNMPPVTLPNLKHKSMIRDEYGNEIVFDSTPGDEHIVMRSPHHDSTFALGRSAITYTSSDEWKATIGDSKKYTYGRAYSLHAGGKASAFFGWSGSLVVGMKGGVFLGGSIDLEMSSKLSAKLSNSCDITKGKKMSYFTGTEASLGESVFYKSVNKDICLDANGRILISGGKENQAAMRCLTDELVLDFGPGSSKKDEDVKRKALAVLVATCSALGAGAAAAAYADLSSAKAAKSAAEGDDRVRDPGSGSPISKEQDGLRAQIAGDTAGLSGMDQWVASLGAAGSMGALKAVMDAAVDHVLKPPESGDKESALGDRDIKSKIRLSADGIEMSSGPKLKSGVHVKKDDYISVHADKDINLCAKDKIYLVSSSNKPVEMKAAKFVIDAILEHGSLKVTK